LSKEEGDMQRRNFHRIDSDVKVRFFCGNEFCSGIITNISEGGMFIRTKISFPFELKFKVIIYLKERLLTVPIKLNRLLRNNKSCDTMAVEVLNPQKDYLEFVERLRSISKFKIISNFNTHGQKRREV
jgi:c-di-GMP-binding flagellar brake protein YcgR